MRSAMSIRSPRPTSTWPTAATCRPRRSSRRRCAPTRAHGDPHQAARGLCQAARHQGLRTAGHPALRADAVARAKTGPRRRSSAARSIPRTRSTSRAADRPGMRRTAARSVEPLGASTMPQSVLPTPSRFGTTASAAPSDARRTWASTSTSMCRLPAPHCAEAPSRCRPEPAPPSPCRCRARRSPGTPSASRASTSTIARPMSTSTCDIR